MNGMAIGMIETHGVPAAVESADVAVKSANVEFLGWQCVDGRVSIFITGDVSAVKASVDAGTQAAARVSKVLSSHVIARTAERLDEILVKADRIPKWETGLAPAPVSAPATTPSEPEGDGDDSESE